MTSTFSFQGADRSAVSSLAQWCRRCRLPALALAGLLPLGATAQPASVLEILTPQNGSYNRSLVLKFTVRFSQPVVALGAPRLVLDVGGATRFATVVLPLSAGQPSNELAFEYVPGATDEDADGIVLANAIDLNGGTIRGADSTLARVDFTSRETSQVTVAVLRPPTPRILAASRDAVDADKLVITGIADGGSLVMLARADHGLVGATIADLNGAWRYAVSGLAAGSYQFSASVENSDGIVSDQSVSTRVTVASNGAVTHQVPAGLASL